jgi:hypothetical protein
VDGTQNLGLIYFLKRSSLLLRATYLLDLAFWRIQNGSYFSFFRGRAVVIVDFWCQCDSVREPNRDWCCNEMRISKGAERMVN